MGHEDIFITQYDLDPLKTVAMFPSQYVSGCPLYFWKVMNKFWQNFMKD